MNLNPDENTLNNIAVLNGALAGAKIESFEVIPSGYNIHLKKGDVKMMLYVAPEFMPIFEKLGPGITIEYPNLEISNEK